MMDVARLDKQKSQLWWTVTILMIMCMYWLSNVVLWVPWSHNPQLGILLMLTVNPLFWAAGIYICLASENRTGNLMKKALVVASLAVGISLIFDYLFFAVYMGVEGCLAYHDFLWLCLVGCIDIRRGTFIKEKVAYQTICCDDKAVADINPVFIVSAVLPVLLFNVR